MDFLNLQIPRTLVDIITDYYNPYRIKHGELRAGAMVQFFKTLNKMRGLPYIKNNLSIASFHLERSAPPYGHCPHVYVDALYEYNLLKNRIEQIEPQENTQFLQI